jgi:serine/threonine protein kinase
MAPEVALGQTYGTSADVFSFGITMAEVALCKKPRIRLPQEYFQFPEKEFAEQLPPEAPEGLQQLTVSCCLLEGHKRPLMSTVVARLSELCDREQASRSPRGAKITSATPPASPRRARPIQLASIQSVAIEKK